MKKIILLLVIYTNFLTLAQSGNGHDPNTILSYTPSGYTVPTYMRQASTSTNTADNTISAGDRTDLYVNFTYDTTGKNVYLVYTTDGSAPTKTNGSIVNGIFSNYSDPNRTWLASILTSANTEGTTIKYVFYISDGILENAYGRVAADGYKTSWGSEGDSYFQYTVEAPLPVQLTKFTVKIFDTNIHLNWQTATEVNNYGFEIERCVMVSLSNHDNWEKIGFVAGYGNSNSPKDYSFIDKNTSSGTIKYRLKQIDFDGSLSYSNEVEVNYEIPLKFILEQNYPNPFNPTTTIKYSIPQVGNGEIREVKLKVYDVLGKEIATLVNESQLAGNYEVRFDGSSLSSGVYLYKLQSGSFVQSRKFIILK